MVGVRWGPGEAVGVGGVGGVEGGLAELLDVGPGAVVDADRRVIVQPGMVVVVVVVVAEIIEELLCFGEAGEMGGVGGAVFHGFEDGFGVGVVVGDAGSGQGSGDAESLVEVGEAGGDHG